MQLKTIISSLIFVLFLNLSISGEAQFELFNQHNQSYENALITEVLNTDTVILDNDEKIKLIGLKAPDVPKKRKKIDRDKYGFEIEEEVSPIESEEDRALIETIRFLKNKHVRLEFDVNRRNNDFETIAYIFLLDDNTLINEEILRQGWADLQIRPPNTKYADQLRKAYQEARREKRGIQNF